MPAAAPGGGGGGGGGGQDEMTTKIDSWAQKLSNLPPEQAMSTISELKNRLPEIGQMIEQKMNMMKIEPKGNAGRGQDSMNIGVNMDPMPVRGAPRRAEAL
jgi:hypothetical protein